MAGRSAFFYGTLMHPKILKRVIGSDGSHLQFCPALLKEYTRHKVYGADYPGIVPSSKGHVLFDRELTEEEKSVRGTLVTGLTDMDMKCLDAFEGSDYKLVKVKVYPLAEISSVGAHDIDDDTMVPSHPPPLPPTLPPAVDCETYEYLPIDLLEAELWNFEDFVKKNAWKWHGKAAQNNEDITEVDRRREAYTTEDV